MAAAATGQPQMSQAVSRTDYPEDVKQRAQSVSVPIVGTAYPPQTLQPPLLPGWIEMKDPAGRPMYVNPATGQSSWQRPVVQPLPPGWQEMQSPDGKIMYFHLQTGMVTYERPGSQQVQQLQQVQQVPPMQQLQQMQPIPPLQQVQQVQQTRPMQPMQFQPTLNHVPAANMTRVAVQRPQLENKSAVSNATKRQVVVKRPLSRAMTAPVTGTATMSVNVDVAGATMQAFQNLPGVQHAQMVHQLSENNNVKVLSKKLASDVAQTSLTAASLATRQAKTVGKMLVSPKKLQRFSKKVIVQTGAASVKAGRACKVVMNEMVDTADGRGKYAQKKGPQTFVAFNATASINANAVGNIHAQNLLAPIQPTIQTPMQPMPAPMVQTNIAPSAQMAIPVRMPTRKPLRKPVGSGTSASSIQASHPSTFPQTLASAQSEMVQAQNTANQHLSQLAPSMATGPGSTQAQVQIQTHGEFKIDSEMPISPTSPTSLVGPPSYHQAIHDQPVAGQPHQTQAHSEAAHGQSPHVHTEPHRLDVNISVGTKPAEVTAQQSHSVDVNNQEHNSHTTTAPEYYIQHGEPHVHQQPNQSAGVQEHQIHELSNLMQQQSLSYVQPPQNYQQSQTTIAADQSVIYDQNTYVTQSVGPGQFGINDQTTYITSSSQFSPSPQYIDPNQGMVYDQVTYVDTGDVTVSEEEIVYVDEDGNVISEEMLTMVDEETGAVYTYEETDVNGVECDTEIDVSGADMGDCDFDF